MKAVCSDGSDRGVSDVVAFVLTFAIIIAGVSVVSIGGFDRLTEFTNEQEVDNSERALEATAATIDSLHRNSDTYREFDLTLSGGTVLFNQTNVTIRSDNITLSKFSSANEATIQTNAIEHRFELSDRNTAVAYEGGAVFRTGTTRPGYRPSFALDGNSAIISLVNLTTDNTVGRASEFRNDFVIRPTGIPRGTPTSADNELVCFRAQLEGQQRIYNSTSVSDLELDVSETAYPRQWAYYFENRDDENWEWNESNLTYSIGPGESLDSVLIRVSTVELSKRQSDCGAVISSD